jgi:hypothetical protein
MEAGGFNPCFCHSRHPSNIQFKIADRGHLASLEAGVTLVLRIEVIPRHEMHPRPDSIVGPNDARLWIADEPYLIGRVIGELLLIFELTHYRVTANDNGKGTASDS